MAFQDKYSILSEIELYRLFRKFHSISTCSPGQHILNLTGSLFYFNEISSITLVIRQPSPGLPGCGIRTRQPSKFWLPNLYLLHLFDNPTTRQSSSDWVSKNGNLKFKNKNAITDTEKGNARRRRGPDATDADLSKEFDDRTTGPFVPTWKWKPRQHVF